MRYGTDDRYDGIPVVDLPITAIDIPDSAHLQRSTRYPGAIDIDPAAAIEAGLDPRALIARDPRSRTGEAVRVIGYSAIAAQVLVVVMIPREHPPTGLWHVATAWPANSTERQLYAAADEEEQP
ncbi:MAG: hypothetical protein M3Z25_07430 [Actinomycetota bacterium]|nr:hypothetical protein [Actinomycetota bacterium]